MLSLSKHCPFLGKSRSCLKQRQPFDRLRENEFLYGTMLAPAGLQRNATRSFSIISNTDIID
jgi:hypothetical protein